ncbi:MAG: carbohydrate-binding domain-containing protein [Deltaproteobacteria bacterium]|nr:carbohydrate-binding domain-containing protein [Deltaproteobacteria bacterium]
MAKRKSISEMIRRFFLGYIFLSIILVFIASGCGGGGGSEDSSGTGGTGDDTSGGSTGTPESEYDGSTLPEGTSFTYEDDDANPTNIIFGSITITGDTESATYDGNTVTINSPGTFNISGTSTDAQIKVDTLEEGDVRLVFEGASITCSFGPPIDIENAERVIIWLEAGTDNYLTDLHTEVVNDSDTEEIDAALYSKDDLIICGSGSITIDTDYKDGIKSKDGLVIDSGNITVTSADDGIIGKNFISINNGNINITAGGDGLKSTEEEDIEKGYIYIKDGVFDIDAGADAVQAQTHIIIQDGEFDIITAGGSNYVVADTAKGLKATVGVTIHDGIFGIDTADDSIHSNDTIVINGGEFEIATGDDGIHADKALTINGGIIDVTYGYEGIESMIITVNDGEIHINSYDDPLNGSDGNRGENSAGVAVYIKGGYIYLECTNADGFDSNGAVYLSGGTVIVNGPVSGANGILDYGTFTTTGGTLVGAGTYNMAQAPGSSGSSQNALLLIFNQKSAGSLFHIETSDGTEVVTFAPQKAYSSVVYTSSQLLTGTTYKVFFDGTYVGGTVKDGVYSGGAYSGGTQYTTFTLSSRVTMIR